jgi:hypothetical protein
MTDLGERPGGSRVERASRAAGIWPAPSERTRDPETSRHGVPRGLFRGSLVRSARAKRGPAMPVTRSSACSAYLSVVRYIHRVPSARSALFPFFVWRRSDPGTSKSTNEDCMPVPVRVAHDGSR